MATNDAIAANHLLIADADPTICRNIRDMAEALSFDVKVVGDSGAVLQTARVWRPSVIILDLQLPGTGTDGIQLLRALAGDRCDAHVVLAGVSDRRILQTAMQLGHRRGLKMSGVLEKPLSRPTLRGMLTAFKGVSPALLRADLVRGLADEQLALDYQPKFSCASRRLIGLEALVRWRHPRLGLLRPDEFLPLAEADGLIDGLTEWVVRKAAEQAVLCRLERRGIGIAVNISAKNIENLDFPDRVSTLCADAGIPPELMTLEFSETGMMRQETGAMDVLTRLRLRGFRLSIDDFGTGYSSFVQLQRMPFSEIKIDKSFVSGMMQNDSCRVIVEIVIDLARRLRMRPVAEGVEDEATFNSLVAMGCDAAQGHYLGAPGPVERLVPALFILPATT